MTKLVIAAACLTLALGLCSCGNRSVPETDCASLAEAEKLVGFRLEAPESFRSGYAR